MKPDTPGTEVTKLMARSQHDEKRIKVEAARKAGKIFCPRHTLAAQGSGPARFSQVLEDFLAYSREHKRSWKADVSRSKVLSEWFGDRLALDVSRRDVERLQAALKGKGLAIATVNRHVRLLSAAYVRASRDGCLRESEYNPSAMSGSPTRTTRECEF